MKRHTVYVAGPMTGLPLFNSPAFDAKAAELFARGYLVHNPASIARNHGLNLADPTCLESQGVPLEVLVRADLAALVECDEVHLLYGWEDSRGTALELQVARACGIRVVGPSSRPL